MGTKLNPNAGFRLGPQRSSNSILAVYGAGTAYSLTAVAALVNLGTTPATLTFTDNGNYLIFARIRFDYNAATFAAVRNVTAKLRRTNNTPSDLSNASAGLKTQVITTLTFSAGDINIPPTVYAATVGDIVQIFASIDVIPTAGTLDCVEAEIVAIKLS